MEIIDAKPEYSRQIFALFETSFGERYMTEEKIRDYIRRGYPFQLAADNKTLLGAVLFVPEKKASVKRRMKIDREKMKQLCRGRSILICKCACVHPKYQGQGIAKKLMERGLEQAKAQKFGAVFTILWKYGGKIPAEKIFQDFHFTQGEELRSPWYQNKEYRCKVCGGRCQCAGVVYYKTFLCPS